MSTIRRQSIISSAIVYFGFALGFLNTYLFTREGGFTQTQYGLTGPFTAIANIMFAFANLGTLAFIYKFYPYYDDNLEPSDNDMMTWALLSSIMGFIFVMIGGYIFKDLIIQKFGSNSADLVKYYYWIFPFGFGLTLFSLLEAFAWQLKKSTLTNFLREVQFRVFTTVLIVLALTKIFKGFDTFIKVYAFTYLGIATLLLCWLIYHRRLHLTFRISRVTKKFYKKILLLCSFVWSGSLVYNIANFFDTLVIAAVMPQGLKYVGIYTLAQYIASLVQAPQRGVISASLGPLSKAWKDKDFGKLNRIYHSSSINQLIFSVGMFILIWINFTDGVLTFHLQKAYLDARYIFLFIGLTRIIDMGTGLNSQIIGTSTFWRFEFFTGIILLGLALPLNYILTKQLGVVGPAISNLIAFTIYNGIRYLFLLRRFRMQPFTLKSLYTLLVGLAGYFVCHFLFSGYQGFWWMVIRSILFITIYLFGALSLQLSSDIAPVWKTVLKKMGIKK